MDKVKKCQYCQGGIFVKRKCLTDDMMEPMVKVRVEPRGFLFIKYKGVHELLDINYCPICGRRLTNKEVV